MAVPANFDWDAARHAFQETMPGVNREFTDEEVHNYVGDIFGRDGDPRDRQAFGRLMQKNRAGRPRQFSAYAPQQDSQPMNFNPIQGAQAHHAAQGNMLQGMAGDAMAAIANENQSRVAQQREMRRMQHEKELEQMRINALIGRLGQSTPGFWK